MTKGITPEMVIDVKTNINTLNENTLSPTQAIEQLVKPDIDTVYSSELRSREPP